MKQGFGNPPTNIIDKMSYFTWISLDLCRLILGKLSALISATIGEYFWSTPQPVTVTNEGLQGFPTKNVIILVVTVTGWGVDPRNITYPRFWPPRISMERIRFPPPLDQPGSDPRGFVNMAGWDPSVFCFASRDDPKKNKRKSRDNWVYP